MNIGFTIGKFAPLHKGHEYLINLGIKEMDAFYVIIYDTPELGFSMKQKERWIKEIFPNVKILYAYDSPKQYGLDKKNVDIQMQYLSNIIKDIPVTHFYSSEEYGYYVAKYLNIKHRQIDRKRSTYPVSASLIRNDIAKYKNYLSDIVYNDLIKNTNN